MSRWLEEIKKGYAHYNSCIELEKKNPELFGVSGEPDSFVFVADVKGDGTILIAHEHGVVYDKFMNPEFKSWLVPIPNMMLAS